MGDDVPSSITWQATLPLAWNVVDMPSPDFLALWRNHNTVLLRALTTLESTAPAEKEYGADHHLATSIERLEAKLDIALSMLAKMAAQQTVMPAATALMLGVREIEWTSDEELPAKGEIVSLRLYLSARLPEPLHIPARIIAVGHGKCRAEYLDLSQDFEELMTRTLFRYHRRTLQTRRHQ